MRIAVTWSRFGPYHLARLAGAARAMPQAHIIGIEVAGEDAQYAWEKAHGADGFDRVTVFDQSSYHDLSIRRIEAGVRDALDRVQPDAMATNGWSVPEARASLAWCRTNGRAAVVMSESKADDQCRVWWKELVKRHLVSRFDGALVGGRPHRAYLERLGFPADRIFFGYDAVDNAYFAAGAAAARADAAALRRQYGLPDRYFFVCTRFIRRKNIAGLLRAYAAYRHLAGADAWDLVIAGGGPEAAAYSELASDLSLAECVHWQGFVQYGALPVYYGLASAFIHPAITEAWGLVLNEAAASGLPILSSRTVGAASELVQDRRSGLLFDPLSEKSMTDSLLAFTRTSDAERARMAETSRAIVQNWGVDRFGAGLCAAIDRAGRP